MLSYAASEMGHGTGFRVHEALGPDRGGCRSAGGVRQYWPLEGTTGTVFSLAVP